MDHSYFLTTAINLAIMSYAFSGLIILFSFSIFIYRLFILGLSKKKKIKMEIKNTVNKEEITQLVANRIIELLNNNQKSFLVCDRRFKHRNYKQSKH